MSGAPAGSREQPRAALSRLELVALVAALMAVNALAIDVMLPALPALAREFAVANDNDRQLVIVSYALASGLAQPLYGPLADALGRRRVLLGALLLHLAASLACVFAGSFAMLLAARVAQGVSGAATRVVSTALVRDLVAGPRMAQIMSTAIMVFLIVPIIAPAIGQLVLALGPWRWVFALLLLAGIALFAWILLRVPETLTPERRIPVSVRAALSAYREVLTNRTTLGYTLAQTLTFGALFSYLTSAQQVFGETFALGTLFPLAFASTGVTLAAAQFTNSRLVTRLGLRPLSHGAGLAFMLLSGLHALHIALVPDESLAVFLALLLPSMFTFGFVGANYSALAMEPMGRVAGSAAAFMGFLSTVGGTLAGGFIGRAFDGTAAPMLHGQALLAAGSLLIVLVTERGRLMRRAPREPS